MITIYTYRDIKKFCILLHTINFQFFSHNKIISLSVLNWRSCLTEKDIFFFVIHELLESKSESRVFLFLILA